MIVATTHTPSHVIGLAATKRRDELLHFAKTSWAVYHTDGTFAQQRCVVFSMVSTSWTFAPAPALVFVLPDSSHHGRWPLAGSTFSKAGHR